MNRQEIAKKMLEDGMGKCHSCPMAEIMAYKRCCEKNIHGIGVCGNIYPFRPRVIRLLTKIAEGDDE